MRAETFRSIKRYRRRTIHGIRLYIRSPMHERRIQRTIRKRATSEMPGDFAFWRSQPVSSRIETLESIRSEYNSWKYGAQSGFQRVYRIIKHA
jgi:hypothetical protein